MDLVGILFGNLVFDGRGDGDVTRLKEHVARRHLRSPARKILQQLFLRVNPVDQFRHVEAFLVVKPAANISQTNNLVSRFLHQVRGHRAHISETLHDHAASLFFHAQLGERLVATHHYPAPGSFPSSARPAQLNRLSGYDRGCSLSNMHRVGVHHPRHGLFAGADVRCGNIALRPQPFRQFRGVPPRQSLYFSARQLARVTNHSALCAPKRDVHDRAFPGHPSRQSAHFVKRYVRSEANPAFSRPPHIRMQHPVTGENFQLPVIHAHRNVQRDFLTRPFQEAVQSLLETKFARGHFKTRFGVLVDIHLFRHHGLGHAKLSSRTLPY